MALSRWSHDHLVRKNHAQLCAGRRCTARKRPAGRQFVFIEDVVGIKRHSAGFDATHTSAAQAAAAGVRRGKVGAQHRVEQGFARLAGKIKGVAI